MRLVRLLLAWLYAQECRAYWRDTGQHDGFRCGRARHHFGRHKPQPHTRTGKEAIR